jgi:methylase of polypeptide subunit release factors
MGILFEFQGLKYITDERVYQPDVDSFLLLRSATPFFSHGAKIIDMGCGTGLLTLAALSRGCEVISIDREPRSLMVTRINSNINGLDPVLYLSDLNNRKESTSG